MGGSADFRGSRWSFRGCMVEAMELRWCVIVNLMMERDVFMYLPVTKTPSPCMPWYLGS